MMLMGGGVDGEMEEWKRFYLAKTAKREREAAKGPLTGGWSSVPAVIGLWEGLLSYVGG